MDEVNQTRGEVVMSNKTKEELDNMLVNVAKAINGIYLSELTVAEQSIFNLLEKAGYVQKIKDEDDRSVVRSLYFHKT